MPEPSALIVKDASGGSDFRDVFMGELYLGVVSANGETLTLSGSLALQIAQLHIAALRSHFIQKPLGE